MKKSLLLLGGLLVPFIGMAQESEGLDHYWVKSVYGLHLSPNGKYVGSMAGNASVYNVETGEDVRYEESFLGLGNCVANSGLAVASNTDDPYILLNGKAIYSQELGNAYWFVDINAITPDGTRITGIVNNPDVAAGMIESEGNSMYIPFVADIDSEGNVSNVKLLPRPTKDFFRATPQMVTAVWISDDGKTIAGQMDDWRGMYMVPIVFNENASGEWSYYLPSEQLFNPTHIDIPDNPWLSEPKYPEPQNYIQNPIAKEAYLAAFENYAINGGPEPDPQEYMSDEEWAEYEAAVNSYNDWFDNQVAYMKEYVQVYNAVLATSPTFTQNEMCLSPDGKIAAYRGGLTNENNDVETKVYCFSTNSEAYSTYDTPDNDFFPQMFTENGTLFITKGQDYVPTSCMLLPGSNEFITIQDYFVSINHPEIAEYLDELCPNGTGVVNSSYDMSLFTGALGPWQLGNFDWEFSDFFYSTYFIVLGSAGVESIIAEPADGVYKAYNLNGVKVLETKDASELNSLGAGIYVINGKKVILGNR